jgi:hypothetical protein
MPRIGAGKYIGLEDRLSPEEARAVVDLLERLRD